MAQKKLSLRDLASRTMDSSLIDYVALSAAALEIGMTLPTNPVKQAKFLETHRAGLEGYLKNKL